MVTKDRVSEYCILCRNTKAELRVGYSRLAECGEMIAVKLSRLDRSRQSGIRSKNLEAQRERASWQCRRAEVRQIRCSLSQEFGLAARSESPGRRYRHARDSSVWDLHSEEGTMSRRRAIKVDASKTSPLHTADVFNRYGRLCHARCGENGVSLRA